MLPDDRGAQRIDESGGRAPIAANLLTARGFTNVHLFTGGFAEWIAAGRPLETADE
ncbi:MAG TPA: rhodanese-like domain-containing protein [Gemmatimonadales bacterium]|nr:rhodanese-like domain-containing protein [Gemmatimonadales bacterium]